MLRLVLALTLASLAAGCGVAPPGSATRVAPTALEAAAANPWLGLKEVSVRAGGPSDWYTRTLRHLDAKTPKNGRLWVLDDPDGVRVLHNTQEVTSAKKLAQLLQAIEAAAEAEAAKDPAQSAQIREFAALLSEKLKK
jgi:hypothetical protein